MGCPEWRGTRSGGDSNEQQVLRLRCAALRMTGYGCPEWWGTRSGGDSKEQQVLRLRCAPLRMTGYGVPGVVGHSELWRLERKAGPSTALRCAQDDRLWGAREWWGTRSCGDSNEKQVLRLRCAALRMTGYGVPGVAGHSELWRLERTAGPSTALRCAQDDRLWGARSGGDSKGQQVLRLRCAPLRMTDCGAPGSGGALGVVATQRDSRSFDCAALRSG